MIGATIVWTIIMEFLFIFRCGTNFNANWGTIQESQEYCSDGNQRQVGFTVTDVFADLVLLVLPLPIVSMLVFSYSNESNDLEGMAFADANTSKTCRLWSVASRLDVSMRISIINVFSSY